MQVLLLNIAALKMLIIFLTFTRALQEIPQKLSLTADEIKHRGQPFTDTDLEEAKQRGRWIGKQAG